MKMMMKTQAITLLILSLHALSACGRTDQDRADSPWPIDGRDAAADTEMSRGDADQGVPDQGVVADMSADEDQGVDPDMAVMPGEGSACELPIMLIPEQPSTPVPWPALQTPICNGDLRSQVHYAIEVPDQHRLTMYGDPVGVREFCGQGCDVSGELINRRGEPLMLNIAAQRYEEDASAQVMARLTPLAASSSCEGARVVPLNVPLSGQDALSGGEFYDPCGLVQSGHTLYYRVSLRLGERPGAVKITATPDDMSSTSISLQALLAEGADLCSMSCTASDDAYFRSAPVASLRVDASAGGGRDPIHLIIAVTMAPSLRPEDASTFTLFVEELD